MGTHRYHFSIVSNGIHCPGCPFGKGCANPATALNKFLPTSCANWTGSGFERLFAAAETAGTSAVELEGLAAIALAD